MSTIDLVATARNDLFSARIMLVLMRVANNVANEVASVPNHSVRLEYAQRVFRGDENPKLVAAHMIAATPAMITAIDANPDLLGSNLTDADLAAAITAIWTTRAFAYSGAT